MKIIITQDDGKEYEILTTPVLTPIPFPTPPPPLPPNKYVLTCIINWGANALINLPVQDSSELTNFVLPVRADGTLLPQNSLAVEQKFVSDVKAAGKIVTFTTFGGGKSQLPEYTIAAITQKTNLINSISTRIFQFGYDGVILDIENVPTLNPQVLSDFITSLRAKLGTKKIGMHVQPAQLTTSHSKLPAMLLDYVSPMIYDIPNTYYSKEKWIELTNAWLTIVPKEKLVIGVAVGTYPPQNGSLNLTQFGEMLDAVKTEGWKGISIWEHTLFSESYKLVRRAKMPNI